MASAKDIVLKIVSAKVANDFVKAYHYSGKIVNNSLIHFGAFLDGVLGGIMSFGCPLHKRSVIDLVHTAENKQVLWNEMLELNRMAFSEILPRNSESRCIAIAIRLMKKHAPHIRWILSFSDALKCGDGTIYRASGFSLVQIKEFDAFYELPNGEVVFGRKLELSGYALWLAPYMGRTEFNIVSKGTSTHRPVMEKIGAKQLKDGYSLKYIFLIDKTCHITVPILPFSDIDKLGAGMYKGEKITLEERHNKQASEAQEKCAEQSSFEVVAQTNPLALFSDEKLTEHGE
jgi:hypothetical protein